jgi:transcriptional regulator with XRE-family HTH domain
MSTSSPPVGVLLREWRERRRLTQLDLALEAEVSTRHVSFLETGRSRPSREMIERLAKQLEIPLRERNALLLSAGFAPAFPERDLNGTELREARAAIDLVLTGHEPYPALAVDRHWTLIAANRATAPFFEGVAPHLRLPPVNVLRATLHPEGLAPRIANLPEWGAHMLRRLRRQIDITADTTLIALLEELSGYLEGTDVSYAGSDRPGFVVPLRLRAGQGILSFLYTTTLFGTPLDVTLDELAIESFFPADRATADALRGMTAPG